MRRSLAVSIQEASRPASAAAASAGGRSGAGATSTLRRALGSSSSAGSALRVASAGAAASLPRVEVDFTASQGCDPLLRDRLDAAITTEAPLTLATPEVLQRGSRPSSAAGLAAARRAASQTLLRSSAGPAPLQRAQSASGLRRPAAQQHQPLRSSLAVNHGLQDLDADGDVEVGDAGNLLGGLSPAAKLANRQGMLSQALLGGSRSRGGLAERDGEGSTEAPTSFNVSVNIDERFGEETDTLVVSIEDLRNRHQCFEGPLLDRSFGGNAQKRVELRELRRERERELEEKRAERFEAYKMCRKVEPELPPLLRQSASSLGESLPSKPRPHIIFRNTSSKALQAQTPQMRKKAERQRQLHHRRQIQSSLRMGQALNEMLLSRREEALNKKMERMEHAKEARRQLASARSPPALAEMWSKFFVVNLFAREVKRSLAVAKEQPAQLSTLFSDQAKLLERIEQDDSVNKTLCLSVMQMKRKLIVSKRRHASRMMWTCLKKWSRGPFFVMMQMFTRKLRSIQRWWRSCRQRLHQIRDELAARWLQLETAEYAKDDASPAALTAGAAAGATLAGPGSPVSPAGRKMGRAPTLTTSGMTSGAASTTAVGTRASLQDDRLLSEAARLRFIEHEMRARRYFILPAVALWEQEWARWEATVFNVRAISSGENAKEKLSISPFKWPPIRPSYLPASHAHDAHEPCPRDCPGRDGDREILSMIQAARRKPRGGGWQEIPPSRPGRATLPRNGQRSSAPAPSNARAATKQRSKEPPASGPFGDVQDEELLRWGIDPELLPGSGGPKAAGLASTLVEERL